MWLVLLAAFLPVACVYLPTIEPRQATHAVSPGGTTRIANSLAALGIDVQNAKRALIVENAELALTTRLDLIDAADHTIDLQYFIWHNDPTGVLVIEKLLNAADRGVRVRVLLDDVQLQGLVNRLNALDDHPNVEIRIFNPFSVRWRYQLGIWRLLEFVLDGNRLNHRMHNKLLAVDNQLAFIGGRNIGDDYFDRSRERNFIDMDLLLSGTVVPQLSSGFDGYWNSRWAYPVNELLNLSVVPDALPKVRKRIRERLQERPNLNALALDQEFTDTLVLISVAPQVVAYDTVIDDPDVSWFDKPDELAKDLVDIAMRAEREVLVVTPYLIPSRRLLELVEELVARGVRIAVVTNSLETNDVVIAQSAYAQSRDRILAAGVELYEMRGDAKFAERNIARNVSLHSKYILFDERHVFMGSLNLDPRSMYLNTELGVVLESVELADQLRASFRQLIEPENAWQLRATEDGVEWVAGAQHMSRAPAKSVWQRMRYHFFQLLPVSQQL